MVTSRRRSALVLVGVVLLALNLRAGLIVLSPLLQHVRADLGMSPAVAGALGAVPPVVFAVVGTMTPRLMRWAGLERLAWIAMLLTGTSQLLRPLVDGAWAFFALSALAYAGMGAGNVLMPPLVKRHFPNRVRVISGVYILLISVGTVVPALVAVPSADHGGWRFAVGAWSMMALAAAVPWLVVSRRPGRRTDRRKDDHKARDGEPREHLPVTALVRSPLAWGLVGVFGINSLNAYAMFAWLPTILIEAGIDEAGAGRYLSLFTLMAAPLAFIVPWLVVRVRGTLPLVILFAACYAAGYVGLLVAPDTGTAVWVALAGLGPGTFPLVLILVSLRSETVAGAMALSGFAQGLGYAIAALGPFVVGVLRDVQDSWTAALIFLLATLVLQILAGFTAARPGTLEAQLRGRATP